MPTSTLSIVIPEYHEEATLAALFARLYPVLDALDERGPKAPDSHFRIMACI